MYMLYCCWISTIQINTTYKFSIAYNLYVKALPVKKGHNNCTNRVLFPPNGFLHCMTINPFKLHLYVLYVSLTVIIRFLKKSVSLFLDSFLKVTIRIKLIFKLQKYSHENVNTVYDKLITFQGYQKMLSY